MFGWKNIDDFTYDDCIDHMNRTPEEEHDPEIVERFLRLNKLLIEADDALFRQCPNSLESCRRYLFSSLGDGAQSFQRRHIPEATNLMNGFVAQEQARKKARRRKIKRYLVTFALIAVFIVASLTYKGADLPDCRTRVEIPEYGDCVRIPIKNGAKRWSASIDGNVKWLKVEEEDSCLVITADHNHDYERHTKITLTSPVKIFGIKIYTESKEILVIQPSGMTSRSLK